MQSIFCRPGPVFTSATYLIYQTNQVMITVKDKCEWKKKAKHETTRTAGLSKVAVKKEKCVMKFIASPHNISQQRIFILTIANHSLEKIITSWKKKMFYDFLDQYYIGQCEWKKKAKHETTRTVGLRKAVVKNPKNVLWNSLHLPTPIYRSNEFLY